MKCMNRLWVVLAVAGASLLAGGCIEEEGHREEEVPVGHVTLPDGSQSELYLGSIRYGMEFCGRAYCRGNRGGDRSCLYMP